MKEQGDVFKLLNNLIDAADKVFVNPLINND
jgi:hypothetical protein